MSYRPYIGNTQLDPGILTDALAGIGSLFGKGKLTATEGVDANGRPTLNYSTSGGDFWDNINRGQAQKANLAAQGLGYKTNMDVYKDKGLNQNKLGFNSQDRINQFTDKARIAQLIQDGAGDSDFLNAESLAQKNRLSEEQAIQQAIQNGFLRKKIQAEMEKQAILNQGNILSNTGLDTENQFRQATNPYRSMQLKAQGENADALYKSQITENNNQGIPRSRGIQVMPDSKGGAIVFNQDAGTLDFMSPTVKRIFGLDTTDPKTGAPVQAFPKDVTDLSAPRTVNRNYLGTGGTNNIPGAASGNPYEREVDPEYVEFLRWKRNKGAK